MKISLVTASRFANTALTEMEMDLYLENNGFLHAILNTLVHICEDSSPLQAVLGPLRNRTKLLLFFITYYYF